MKWIYSPLAMMRTAFATGAVFTMCFSPLAEAKKAEKYSKTEKLNMYLKETHLADGKDRTWGDLWAQIRGAYPAQTRYQMDFYIAKHRLEPLPKTTASTFKDANGKEQVRFTMTDKKGQVTTVTLTGDEDKPMKVNNITFDKKDMFSLPATMKKISADPQVQKMMKGAKAPSVSDRDFMLTPNEYNRLAARQKAEYLYRMRITTLAAQKIFVAKYGLQAMNDFNSKYDVALNFLLGDLAEAKVGLEGVKCINAGFFSQYNKGQTCDEVKSPLVTCSGNDVGCNPLVYGYDTGGATYCVPHSQRKYATRECGAKSKLETAQDKKRIIESYLNRVKGENIDLSLNKDGKVPSAEFTQAIQDYIKELKSYIKDGEALCGTEPTKSTQKKRDDLLSACDELKKRAFDLEAYATNPQPPVVLPLPAPPAKANTGTDCDATYATGAIAKDDGKGCQCPDGSSPQADSKEPSGKICGAGGGVFAAGALGDGTKEEKDKDDKKGGFGWLWPVGLIAGAALLGWGAYELFKPKDDKKDNTYINPINNATDPTTPGVTDPECAPGFVRDTVGGVCHETVIPVIPVTPVTPTTPVTPVTPTLPTAGEGTGGTDNILSGGTIQQR